MKAVFEVSAILGFHSRDETAMFAYKTRSKMLLKFCIIKPGFHVVVSVVSVVRKKFIGQLQLYGNLPYKCSIQKKRQIQLFVRDRMNSICPMDFFRTTDTTDTTDSTIWKPGLIGSLSKHDDDGNKNPTNLHF